MMPTTKKDETSITKNARLLCFFDLRGTPKMKKDRPAGSFVWPLPILLGYQRSANRHEAATMAYVNGDPPRATRNKKLKSG